MHRLFSNTQPPEPLATYEATETASLEYEIRVACANAARLQALLDAAPGKRVVVSFTGAGGQHIPVVIRPSAELLAEQHDLIRKLKLA